MLSYMALAAIVLVGAFVAVYSVCMLMKHALLLPGAILAGALFTLRLSWRLALKGASAVAKAARAWLRSKLMTLQDALRRRTSAAKAADQEPKADAKAGPGADGTREDGPRARSPYDEALELLGLSGVEPLTRDVLKERVREIMSRIHPDKGFPNHVFAQQINMAAQRVKMAKGWR